VTAVSGTTRALACLALGHEDDDEPRCSSSDEDLVRQLVEQVQALRVAAGIVEESEADRAEATAAIVEAFDTADAVEAEVSDEWFARILDALNADGWTLHRVRRP